MLKPDPAGPPEQAAAFALTLGLPAGAPDREAPAHSPVELLVRRLRYYVDLLQAGYRHALHPDPLPHSLRAERIALGIDLPELDTVPLWSARRDDGSVSVPFIEFILGQVAETLDALLDAPVVGPGAREALLAARADLLEAQVTIEPAAGPRAVLPRLRDVYLQERVVDGLCGRNGILERQRSLCEALLAAPRPAAGH